MYARTHARTERQIEKKSEKEKIILVGGIIHREIFVSDFFKVLEIPYERHRRVFLHKFADNVRMCGADCGESDHFGL